MNDRDYERMERRIRTRRRGRIASIIAGVVIVAAVAVIIVVVISVASRNAQPTMTPTEAATEQPTLYKPTEASATSAPTSAYQQTTDSYVQPTALAYAPTITPDDVTQADAQPATQYSEQAVSGALHYYASGKTTEGYNWTYSSYGTTVDITCKYDFGQNRYDFIITGTSPGTTSFTLVYYAADDQPVSVPMTVSVDESLRVTQIG